MEILSRYVAQLVATIEKIELSQPCAKFLSQKWITHSFNSWSRDEITNFFPLFSASPRICFGYKHGQEYSTVSYIYTHYIAC